MKAKTKTKQTRKPPLIKIQELKKDIDLFQSEIKQLLEKFPIDTDTDSCVVCHQKNTDYQEFPCQHLICQSCFEKLSTFQCPDCHQNDFHYSDSSSSDDN